MTEDGCQRGRMERPAKPLGTDVPREFESHPVRFDGESWEDYAGRLERRIKEQRVHINSLHRYRKDGGNRQQRKRTRSLETTLGRVAARLGEEERNREALAAKLDAADARVEQLTQELEDARKVALDDTSKLIRRITELEAALAEPPRP